MVKTSFWSPTGQPISSTEFIEQLFGDIPNFFKSEKELRKIWSLPDTRKKLLQELSEQVKLHFDSYNIKQQEFLNFVLNQYVKDGVESLNDSELPKILELKYEAIEDAKPELGSIKDIRETFIGFQEYLCA